VVILSPHTVTTIRDDIAKALELPADVPAPNDAKEFATPTAVEVPNAVPNDPPDERDAPIAVADPEAVPTAGELMEIVNCGGEYPRSSAQPDELRPHAGGLNSVPPDSGTR